MSEAAAQHAAASLREAIERTGKARVVAATGASQLDFLSALTATPGIAWPRVELFHLDEYIGLPAGHPASFRRYLREHLIDKTGITTIHFLDGEGNPDEVRRNVGHALAREPVDLLFAGIGENTHLAFNDPPADFDTTEPYIVVKLDEACRRQQVGEGWFATGRGRAGNRRDDFHPADTGGARDPGDGPGRAEGGRRESHARRRGQPRRSGLDPPDPSQRHALPRRGRGRAPGPRHAGALRAVTGRRQETGRSCLLVKTVALCLLPPAS